LGKLCAQRVSFIDIGLGKSNKNIPQLFVAMVVGYILICLHTEP
jgi:hypothetical protein